MTINRTVLLTPSSFTGQALFSDGTAALPSIAFINDQDTGFYLAAAGVIGVSSNGTGYVAFAPQTMQLHSAETLAWSSGALLSTSDVLLVRDAAGILASKNATTAQKVRIYGTTTNTNYAQVEHDGTNAKFTTSGGGVILGQASSSSTVTTSGGVRQIYVDYADTSGGVTGNQTINKMSGSVNVAGAGTTVTVTNSIVTTSSKVFAVIGTADATARIANVIPGSGSFIINLVAATGETRIHWLVLNAN